MMRSATVTVIIVAIVTMITCCVVILEFKSSCESLLPGERYDLIL